MRTAAGRPGVIDKLGRCLLWFRSDQPRRRPMKNGFRVYDSDTHINPAAEILDKYVDPDFRPRLPELAPYRVSIGQAVEGPSERHNYPAGTKYNPRILGEAG